VEGGWAVWSGCRSLLIKSSIQERSMTIHALRATPYPPFHDGEANISRHTIGRRTVISVGGEVDLLSTPALRRAIDETLATGGVELWIDLTTTEFMDSSGLHALLDAQERVCELRRRLTVICPPGSVRRLFEVAAVTDRLTLAADRAAAHRHS
jgi:anti-anti-sigma factor